MSKLRFDHHQGEADQIVKQFNQSCHQFLMSPDAQTMVVLIESDKGCSMMTFKQWLKHRGLSEQQPTRPPTPNTGETGNLPEEKETS